MSNGILKRQNEDSNIARLAAQRQLYRDVNIIEILGVIFTVLVPIGLSVIQDIVGLAKTVASIVAFVMICFSFVVDNVQNDKKRLAATIQQEFDINVFSMVWDDKLFGVRKNINSEIAAMSKKIMRNEKERAALANWYREETDSMSLEEGIAACQKENFCWDAGLRKRYRLFLVICLAFIISVQFILGIQKAEPMQEWLLRLVAYSPAFKWITKTISGINADLKRMESVEHSVYSTKKKTMEELAITQKDIFENRKILAKIPDWFYKIFKDNDEDRERRALELN